MMKNKERMKNTLMENPESRVAAFIVGECRGVSQLEGGLYYLLIAGEGSGKPVELCVAKDGEVLLVDNSLTFVTDANIGTPWDPYVLDLHNALGISEIGIDGDPDEWYTLQGIKIGRKPTKAGAYIHNGRVVIVK